MAEPIYDVDGEDLKELVKRQGVQITEMQHTLRSMHNAQRRHFIYKIVWWLLITGVAAYSYYTFVWPVIQPIIGAYGDFQGYQSQVLEFFQNMRPGTTTTE